MKISIKWILFFAFALLVLGSIGFVATSSYHTSKNALQKHAKEIMSNIVTFTTDKAVSHIIVAKDASELTQGLANQNVVNSEDFAGMEEYFLEQLKVHRQFFNIYYGNENGSFIMASRDANNENIFTVKRISTFQNQRKVTLTTVDDARNILDETSLREDVYDPRVRPWYKQSKAEKKTIWTDPYIFFSSKKPGITAASPVMDNQGYFQGSVGVDIKVKELSDFLATFEFSERGSIAIFDEKTNVIASNRPGVVTQMDEKTKEYSLAKLSNLNDPILLKAFEKLQKSTPLAQLYDKRFIHVEHNGQSYHAIFSPFSINDIKWIIGIYLSESSYLGSLKSNQQTNTYIAFGIALIALYLGYIISQKISTPISQMQDLANEIKLRHMDVPKLPPSIFKEIDSSSQAFHEIKDDLIKYDEQNKKLNQDLHNASLDTLYRLAVAAEYKDTDTAEHIKRISEYSKVMARELGLKSEDIYIIEHASIMHDVGKLGIADKILLKPGKLTEDEMKIMKTHSLIGAKILDNPSSQIMVAARDIALNHHEKFDGSGYPYGLKGDEIPFMARIVAVVDVFDALVSKRCYKDAFSIEDSLAIIREGRGSHFDPQCVDAFEKNLDKMIAIYKTYN